METLLIIVLAVAVLGLLPRGAGPAAQPQWMLVQAAAPAEEPGRAPGCLLWVLGALLLLVVGGVIKL